MTTYSVLTIFCCYFLLLDDEILDCNFWFLMNSMLKQLNCQQTLIQILLTVLLINETKFVANISVCIRIGRGSIFVLRCMSGFICCTRLFSCTPNTVFITFTGTVPADDSHSSNRGQKTACRCFYLIQRNIRSLFPTIC